MAIRKVSFTLTAKNLAAIMLSIGILIACVAYFSSTQHPSPITPTEENLLVFAFSIIFISTGLIGILSDRRSASLYFLFIFIGIILFACMAL
jgi:hypothetical protein